MSKSYRAIFLHVIFQIRKKKNHPFFPEKTEKYSSKNFNFFLSFPFFLSFFYHQREISFLVRISIGSDCNFSTRDRATNSSKAATTFHVFGGASVSLKARRSTDPVGSFSTFIRGFWTRESGSGVCTFPVQTGSDVAEISLLAPPESIVRHHRSRLVRRSNEILTRPIPTCHSSPSRVPTLFPYNLHEDFVSSPSGVAPTPDFISSRLMLLIFLPLPFPIILPACILSWLG